MLDRVSTRSDAYIDVSPPPAGWLSRLRSLLPGPAADAARSDSALATPAERAARLLDELGVSLDCDSRSLDNVPRRGRVLLVANHPFGALDGLVVMALLRTVRPDLMVLANGDLCALRGLAPALLPIETTGTARTSRNAQAMRGALQWLEHGGAVLAFPAAAVARFDARSLCVSDPPWSRAVAMLARKTRPAIVPLHLGGNSGLRFHALGFVHPALRTLLLPRELRSHAGRRVPVRIGAPLPFERLRHFDDEALTAHLRLTTYLLERGVDAGPRAPRQLHPVAAPAVASDCERELAGLDAARLLVDDGEHAVWCAPAAEIPHVLEEIGRLREVAGRTAGVGSGHARDLDDRDHRHEHVVVWHRARREIVAGCGIGRLSPLRRRAARRELYAARRFRLRDAFFALTGPMLEIGRPFVRVERQGTITPLRLLWKGIGALLARRPRYRLLASLDVTAGLGVLSRELLVEYLRTQSADRLLGLCATPLSPAARAPLTRSLAAEVAMLGHFDALLALIDDLEPAGRGVSPMLRAILELGARFIASDGADCLFVVDLRHSDPRALRRWMPGPLASRITGSP